MTRTTIDFGIDLGTTNSAIAVLEGTEAKVIKNNEQSDITPSAVYMDKRGRVYVGRTAKEAALKHPYDAVREFKRRMGFKDHVTTFKETGRSMKPEELSAEVLKSLRANVRQRLDEEIRAAVITVPAAFELNQIEATKRAAELAGFDLFPLIQEPTAAAFAYGFQSEADNKFWLVYDLGGGTFDAAIVHLRDGEFNVVSHDGDNHMGGQKIDDAIVGQELIPAVSREFGLTDFPQGGNWGPTLAKLKLAAEQAKINLSHMASTEILVEDLFKGCERDGVPDGVDFEYALDRREVERLAGPLYVKTLEKCRKALAEAKLAPDEIEKVLLVGGPTLAPGLRDMLKSELGIELDLSQDPLTVVARGAAVFAGAQQLPRPDEPLRPGQYAIEFPDFESIGVETEPLVGGRVAGPSELPAGLAIEFENAEAKPAWSSGKVPVQDNGTFVTTLWAEKGRQNRFGIVLTDGTGSRLDASPDHLDYTPGAVEAQPLLTHTIGLWLANNNVMKLVSKGEPLPARGQAVLTTVVEVHKGSGEGLIRIPIVEGEHPRADRNSRIGMLEVHPEDIPKDLPVGSDVEFEVRVDASRLGRATAYVPIIDSDYEADFNLKDVEVPKLTEITQEIDDLAQRHAELRDTVQSSPGGLGQAKYQNTDIDRDVEKAKELAATAENGTEEGKDAAIEARKRIQEANAALDEVEAAQRWPELVKRAEALIDEIGGIVIPSGDLADRRRYNERVSEVRKAIDIGDPHLLEQRCAELSQLLVEILHRGGDLELVIFKGLKERLPEMTDPFKARQLMNEGERAIASGQAPVLVNVNRQLQQLLPVEVQAELISTVLAKDAPQ